MLNRSLFRRIYKLTCNLLFCNAGMELNCVLKMGGIPEKRIQLVVVFGFGRLKRHVTGVIPPQVTYHIIKVTKQTV